MGFPYAFSLFVDRQRVSDADFHRYVFFVCLKVSTAPTFWLLLTVADPVPGAAEGGTGPPVADPGGGGEEAGGQAAGCHQREDGSYCQRRLTGEAARGVEEDQRIPEEQGQGYK